MKRAVILAAVLGFVAGLARSEDKGLVAEIESGRAKFDGVAAKKSDESGGVVASVGAIGSAPDADKTLKRAGGGQAKPQKALPPRVTGSSPLPHSNKPAEGPRKHLGALILGAILGAVLVRRVVEVREVIRNYSGGGGSSGD